MEERLITQVVGQVMVYDSTARQWHPAGTSSGLSTVRLIHCLSNNTFRIHGQKINELKEVVLDSQITREVKYNRANEAFIQWHDSQAFWGLNFRRGSPDAETFFASVVTVLKILNQNAAQQHQQPIVSTDATTNHQQNQQVQQQQQQQILQQHPQQQAPQTTLMQQQAQILNQQQVQAAALLNQGPPIMQQQQQNQQHLLQQHIHQHYMQQQQQQHQQQPQAQSHQPNHNQMNHYQHPHPQHLQQHTQQLSQPQIQQQQQQQIQPQVAPVVAAPIPPPPPPPPPAPPVAVLNNNRINGTVNNVSNSPTTASNASTNPQHSPLTNSNMNCITNGTNNVSADRNGGSPNQVSSLTSEIAKCQLKKVNLSRSDSNKESESNSNNIGNPKTTRAASITHGNDPLMNDLSKKLASRRERLDQQGDNQPNSNTNMANGIHIDKALETFLTDLFRKEMTKMKAEIIDVIKAELKQR